MDDKIERRKGRSDDLDFMVEIHATRLRYCRERLALLQRSRFPAKDLWLAISTLSAGASLGAVTGGLTTASSLGWLFYTVMPMIAAAAFVAYMLLENKSVAQGATIAENILDSLPDPDDTTPCHSEYVKLAGLWDIESLTTSSQKGSRGELTVSVRQTTITISGVVIGESDTRIAEISSRFASYDPSMKRLMFIYGYAAVNDDGGLDNSECVFSGVVFGEQSDLTVRGNWVHLTGPAFAGTAILRKKR